MNHWGCRREVSKFVEYPPSLRLPAILPVVFSPSSAMATNVDCPSCDQKLRVPEDLLGKKVKCPACKTMFKATASGLKETAQVPPVEEEEKASFKNPSGLSSSKRSNLPSKRSAPSRDDEDEDDEDDDRPRRRSGRNLRKSRRLRRDLPPHKGVIILILGIVGLVAFPILCPIAWIMGNIDIKEIRAGRMDPEGESMTNIGRILGIVGTILHGLALLAVCLYFVVMFVIFAALIGGASSGAQGR
jgi:predicted Zn finger-like uncharacterized protein